MAISGSIFGRGVAMSRFGADVLKLRQKFKPYMGPRLVALTQKALKKVCPPPNVDLTTTALAFSSILKTYCMFFSVGIINYI